MAMPRRFWVLVGWVIALATLATAFAVVESTYRDMGDLAGCEAPAAAPDYAVCSRFRFIEGSAEVAGVVAKVPAFGLAAIAAAIGFAHRARPGRVAKREAADASSPKASGAGDAGAPAKDAGPARAVKAPKAKPA